MRQTGRRQANDSTHSAPWRAAHTLGLRERGVRATPRVARRLLLLAPALGFALVFPERKALPFTGTNLYLPTHSAHHTTHLPPLTAAFPCAFLSLLCISQFFCLSVQVLHTSLPPQPPAWFDRLCMAGVCPLLRSLKQGSFKQHGRPWHGQGHLVHAAVPLQQGHGQVGFDRHGVFLQRALAAWAGRQDRAEGNCLHALTLPGMAGQAAAAGSFPLPSLPSSSGTLW